MIEINQNEIKSWISQSEGYVYISKQKFHRNAELFLRNFPDIQNSIIENIEKELKKLNFKVSDNKKNKYFKRVGATSLNKSLKHNFKEFKQMKFEVEYKEGILFDSSKTGGFDFALYDEEFNVTNYRNYCFGKKGIYQGNEVWNKEINKKRRKEWKLIADKYDLLNSNNLGQDLPTQKKHPTIIGEFQFGNWALAYYDMFKVLHLDNLADIDLLIYITATGNLNEYLSDGIVDFEMMSEILDQYSSILKVPIWLIGIDIQS